MISESDFAFEIMHAFAEYLESEGHTFDVEPDGDKAMVLVTSPDGAVQHFLLRIREEGRIEPADTRQAVHVHVIGPNLPDQSKGQFHVHAKDCADVTRSRDYRSKEFAHDRSHTIEVKSLAEVSAYVYADQIGQGEMTAEGGVSDIYVFPCVSPALT